MKTLLYTVYDTGYTTGQGMTPEAKIYEDEDGKLILDAIEPLIRPLLDSIEFKGTTIPLSDKAAYCEALERKFCQSSTTAVSKETKKKSVK